MVWKFCLQILDSWANISKYGTLCLLLNSQVLNLPDTITPLAFSFSLARELLWIY